MFFPKYQRSFFFELSQAQSQISALLGKYGIHPEPLHYDPDSSGNISWYQGCHQKPDMSLIITLELGPEELSEALIDSLKLTLITAEGEACVTFTPGVPSSVQWSSFLMAENETSLIKLIRFKPELTACFAQSKGLQHAEKLIATFARR